MENQKFQKREAVIWKGHKGWVVGYNENHPELVQILFPFGLRQFRENDPDISKADEPIAKKE